MIEPRFTKGPWHTRNEVIYESSNRRVARVEKHYWPDDEKKANAQLITCAPELYAMVEELTHFVEDMPMGSGTDRWYELVERANGLLDKARGEHE